MSKKNINRCNFLNSLGICASPINTNDIQCVNVPIDLCYFKQLQAKEQECEKFKNRADELMNTLAKVNKKIHRIIEIDGDGFDEALTEEFESIKNLIHKAVFTTGENECQTKQ